MKPLLLVQYAGIRLYARLERETPRHELAYVFKAECAGTRVPDSGFFYALWQMHIQKQIVLSERQARLFDMIYKRNRGYNVQPTRFVDLLARKYSEPNNRVVAWMADNSWRNINENGDWRS